jgi:hypothetical protein
MSRAARVPRVSAPPPLKAPETRMAGMSASARVSRSCHRA